MTISQCSQTERPVFLRICRVTNPDEKLVEQPDDRGQSLVETGLAQSQIGIHLLANVR